MGVVFVIVDKSREEFKFFLVSSGLFLNFFLILGFFELIVLRKIIVDIV